MRTTFLGTLLVAFLSLGSSGCIKKMLLDGQIKSTRVGAGAADTIGDYELARSASQAALMQFEGMHRLAPDNEDALYLLMRGWGGYGYAFPQDDWEVASLAGDEEKVEYHKRRATLAFDRSIAYGVELISKRDAGFPTARKNAAALKTWLKENFKDAEDAETLFWLGSVWMARTALNKDDMVALGDLYVGVEIVERSRELDPTYMAWASTSIIASYHARTAMQLAELEEGKKMFELALAKTQRKSLSVQLSYAQKYACNKGDQALYEALLNEVVSTEDPDPNLRLQNTIAKRRAKRSLSKAAMEDCAFRTLAPPPAAPAASPASPK